MQDTITDRVRREGLAAAERAVASEFVELCDRHEGLELPLNLSERSALREGESTQLLWYEGGALVGFLSADFMSEVEVCLAVHPGHRRQGIGRALLGAAAEECRQRGIGSWLLVTDEASPSGRAFAAAMGGRYRESEYRMELEREHVAGPHMGPEPLELRLVGAGDVEKYARLRAASFGGAVEQWRRRVARELERPNHWLYLGIREGEPIGTIRVGTFGARVYLTAFSVLPEYRGRGYGRQILSRMVHRLLEEDRWEIFIEVATENRNALGLYRSCGFRETRTYGFYEMRSLS